MVWQEKMKRAFRSSVNACFFAVFAGHLSLYCSVAASQSLSGNIVKGKVTVLDRLGNRVDDHSSVVVFVDGIIDGPEIKRVDQPIKMSHQHRKFSPRILPIVRGSRIDFFNDDRIFHNVFSLSKANTFDLGIYPQGTSKLVTFDRPGLVKIYCNIHPKMVSNILVLNNPFFAITSSEGIFEINNIPDGEFVLRTWHELGEGQGKSLVFEGGRQTIINPEIRLTKKRTSHKNKFGKSYRNKY